ncbi:MAG: hypothetical protein IMZ70_01930 [Candidatus Atribacteria bacterium]|nr:hypothetical protein [Candidatus Atribacteria bacterium]MBE3144975.1 hypothetical protein [Planctomycetota bacterium]
MADVDTIVVLDGLQITKPDTAEAWTVDGVGEQYEAVKTYAIPLPTDISAARVIFNAANATAATQCHCRVKLSKTTGLGTLAKTQNTQVMEWTVVVAPAIIESGDADVSLCYTATLHIDVALSETTAVVAGIEIIVQIKKESGVDEWTDVARFMGPTGTGSVVHFSAEEAAAQTILSVANPTAAKFDHVGKFIFLEDTVTVANCEIAFLTGCGADA